MILPCGAYVEFRKHCTRRDAPHTVHILDLWASEADFKAGKPGVRWDETIAWCAPHRNPASRILKIIDGRAKMALAPPPIGRSHFDAAIVPLLSDAPDEHGNLAHPSMQALQAVPG